ncbi:MAG: prepilin-type N-terminal cleavage/methylation domain-containing protein [Gammaproteobacteria bacterium]|nr:MAG: prepilin-type N-terminal cleavage/methylation domain-containing protein [Gammaproteobacteria bacterium]
MKTTTWSVATAGAGRGFGGRARERGLTMIEMLITVVIFAILMAIAIPSFRDASLGGRLAAAANNLLASVQLARSEAIKRNVAVTLCASANGTSCAASGDWEQGWIVRDAVAAEVIQRQQALPDGYRMTQAGGTSALSFQPIGIGATAATFTVCRESPVGSQERVVTVTASGSVYVTTTTTGTCP